MMNWPLSISSLWTLSRVNTEFVSNHFAGEDGTDRTTAVDADQNNIVHVNLLAFCKLKETHYIAAFDGNPNLFGFCSVQVFLYQFWQEKGSAVEGTGSPGKFPQDL